jgi:hypothetical protein
MTTRKRTASQRRGWVRVPAPVADPVPVSSEAVGRDPLAPIQPAHQFEARVSKYDGLMASLEASLDSSGVSGYVFMAEDNAKVSWRSRLDSWAKAKGLTVRQIWYPDAVELDQDLAGRSGYVVWTVPSRTGGVS